MNLESSFLTDIVADPSCRTAALVYADWLDDEGRGSEALLTRYAAKSGMVPRLSKDGSHLGWWDEIMERWVGHNTIGKVWLVECWGWTPKNLTVEALRTLRQHSLPRSALEE